jgi:hypothetical protein
MLRHREVVVVQQISAQKAVEGIVHVEALKMEQVIEMEGMKNRPSDLLHVPVEEEAVEVLSLIPSRL